MFNFVILCVSYIGMCKTSCKNISNKDRLTAVPDGSIGVTKIGKKINPIRVLTTTMMIIIFCQNLMSCINAIYIFN